MNLQVSVPHQKCVYSCPMCVARAHANEGTFENLYKTNKKEWYRKLEKLLLNNNYSSIVLTGECDPTQDMRYCDDVIAEIRTTRFEMPTIEFTTHNQKAIKALYDSAYGRKVDVITLSITNAREYLNAWRFPERNAFFSPIYRMVILLTDEFEFLNVNNFNTMGFDQITFKTLQHGEDPNVNKWIDANRMSEEGLAEIRKIVDKYNSYETCSVRLDTSCQDATNRYEIFRSDGEVYDSWEAMYPKGAVKKSREDLTAQDMEIIKRLITDCAKDEARAFSVDNAIVKLGDLKDITSVPERTVYKDIPAPVIKEAEEKDYD